MTDPAIMCRKHLLGEHVELHMFVGSINKGVRMGRYVTESLLEFDSLRSRHVELVREMKRRGYKHTSPLPAVRSIPKCERIRIDRAASLAELLRRCPECRAKAGPVDLAVASVVWQHPGAQIDEVVVDGLRVYSKEPVSP